MPVCSEFLAKRLGKISPATIRNEMTILTKEGFLLQPHTSSGRAPSEAAYRHYIEHLKIKNFVSREVKFLKNILTQRKTETPELILKRIAKQMSGAAEETILLAFDKNDFYYTGFNFLLNQPEFNNLNLIHDISEIIGRVDEILDGFLPTFNREELQIFLGESCPFGKECSLIAISTDFISGRETVIGLLGPLRMDYSKNIALMKNLKEILSKI